MVAAVAKSPFGQRRKTHRTMPTRSGDSWIVARTRRMRPKNHENPHLHFDSLRRRGANPRTGRCPVCGDPGRHRIEPADGVAFGNSSGRRPRYERPSPPRSARSSKRLLACALSVWNRKPRTSLPRSMPISWEWRVTDSVIGGGHAFAARTGSGMFRRLRGPRKHGTPHGARPQRRGRAGCRVRGEEVRED